MTAEDKRTKETVLAAAIAQRQSAQEVIDRLTKELRDDEQNERLWSDACSAWRTTTDDRTNA